MSDRELKPLYAHPIDPDKIPVIDVPIDDSETLQLMLYPSDGDVDIDIIAESEAKTVEELYQDLHKRTGKWK